MLNLLLKNTDFISLDTLGFAQVGSLDYNEKIIIEKKVIENFFKDSKNLAVPLNFVKHSYFKWTENPHDFGFYWDFTIIYDTDYLKELDDAKNYNTIAEFWEWISRCEEALSDNETLLLTQCKTLYETT